MRPVSEDGRVQLSREELRCIGGIDLNETRSEWYAASGKRSGKSARPLIQAIDDISTA